MKLQKMLSVICVLSALCGMSWAGEAVKSQNTQVVSNTTDVCFYPFFSGGSITNPGGSIFHVSVFTMPFAKAWNVSKNTFTQDDTVNPFVFSESKDNADGPFMEQPLCCLYSEVDINPATSPAATASSVMARRWRLVDTCVLRVWQLETWGKGKYGHWTFLNPQPLDLALLDVETGAKKTTVCVLDMPHNDLLGVYRDCQNGDEKETSFLHLLKGAVVNDDTRNGDDASLTSASLVSVWEKRENGKRKEWSFLRTPVCSVAGGWQKKDAGLTYVLRLPVIGPVWSVWHVKEANGAEAKVGSFFPRLLHWNHYPDPMIKITVKN